MHRQRRPVFIVATIALAVASWAGVGGADVTGRWTATFDTDAGEQSYTYEFVVKGGQLTGTAKGNLVGESKIADGKVEGNTISFVENATFQGVPLRIVYTGTLTSADEIAFTRRVADVATEKFVARRAQ
jgi:hypothetical protein